MPPVTGLPRRRAYARGLGALLAMIDMDQSSQAHCCGNISPISPRPHHSTLLNTKLYGSRFTAYVRAHLHCVVFTNKKSSPVAGRLRTAIVRTAPISPPFVDVAPRSSTLRHCPPPPPLCSGHLSRTARNWPLSFANLSPVYQAGSSRVEPSRVESSQTGHWADQLDRAASACDRTGQRGLGRGEDWRRALSGRAFTTEAAIPARRDSRLLVTSAAVRLPTRRLLRRRTESRAAAAEPQRGLKTTRHGGETPAAALGERTRAGPVPPGARHGPGLVQSRPGPAWSGLVWSGLRGRKGRREGGGEPTRRRRTRLGATFATSRQRCGRASERGVSAVLPRKPHRRLFLHMFVGNLSAHLTTNRGDGGDRCSPSGPGSSPRRGWRCVVRWTRNDALQDE